MKRPAFTIVELLVYIGISAIALVIITNFAAIASGNAARSKITQELQHNARLALDRLSQEVRSAQAINAATNYASDPGTLVLTTASGNHTFAVANGVLTLDSGAGGQALTSSKVTVNSFQLVNATPGITITLMLSETFSNPAQTITVSTSLIPHQRLYQ